MSSVNLSTSPMVVKVPLSPRKSAKFISERAKHVTIHPEGISKLAKDILKQLREENIRISSPAELETFPADLTEKDAINLVFVIDTLNFCFWIPKGAGPENPNPPKWEVTFRNQTYTGYFALCAAIGKALDNGKCMHNPDFYSKITLKELKDILKGNNSVDIPLLTERLNCLHEVGKILIDKFDGYFINCIKKCNKNAQSLLRLITSEFPCFNDIAAYKGESVSFHKRAQILVADVWSLYYGEGISEFEDIDTITMFADYRVPQVLVLFETMSYSEELMNVLREEQEMTSGCEMEAEIRGCSIEVVERLKEEVERLMVEEGDEGFVCNSILIDNYLWSYRRAHALSLTHIPFHRVPSLYY
ncbi:queuosine 5'-phosphate N-glycosylase/hydrolase [Halyomorpha halys]|uniref:queuosine 5'-phosphate N-glycosylase/hydrolase n=1 Tax=Halyomorpha halys TaxID=286706 RepID=UPI0006D50297|nr:queuosine salvage protein [Halyomorpha halys]